MNQIIFVSKKVEMLVDEILLRSEVSPIIILQANHGTASTFQYADNGGLDCVTEINLRERMRIFNTIHSGVPMKFHREPPTAIKRGL